MGISSVWHWLLVLLIVVLIFGTKKLRNMGKDLGGAVHDFKQGLNEGGEAAKNEKSDVIEHQHGETKSDQSKS